MPNSPLSLAASVSAGRSTAAATPTMATPGTAVYSSLTAVSFATYVAATETPVLHYQQLQHLPSCPGSAVGTPPSVTGFSGATSSSSAPPVMGRRLPRGGSGSSQRVSPSLSVTAPSSCPIAPTAGLSDCTPLALGATTGSGAALTIAAPTPAPASRRSRTSTPSSHGSSTGHFFDGSGGAVAVAGTSASGRSSPFGPTAHGQQRVRRPSRPGSLTLPPLQQAAAPARKFAPYSPTKGRRVEGFDDAWERSATGGGTPVGVAAAVIAVPGSATGKPVAAREGRQRPSGLSIQPPPPPPPQQQQQLSSEGPTLTRFPPVNLSSTDLSYDYAASCSGTSDMMSPTSSGQRVSKCKRKMQAVLTAPAFDIKKIEEVSNYMFQRQAEAFTGGSSSVPDGLNVSTRSQRLGDNTSLRINLPGGADIYYDEDITNAAECHPITQVNDFIFLGTWRDAHSTETLNAYNISYVLNCASEIDHSEANGGNAALQFNFDLTNYDESRLYSADTPTATATPAAPGYPSGANRNEESPSSSTTTSANYSSSRNGSGAEQQQQQPPRSATLGNEESPSRSATDEEVAAGEPGESGRRRYVSATLPMRDSQKEQLDKKLEAAFFFLALARKHRANVLIHCRRGISRSAAIVIAFLMATQHTGFEETYSDVLSKRSCISLNLGFHEYLSENFRPCDKWANIMNRFDARAKTTTTATAVAAAPANAARSGSNGNSVDNADNDDDDEPFSPFHKPKTHSFGGGFGSDNDGDDDGRHSSSLNDDPRKGKASSPKLSAMSLGTRSGSTSTWSTVGGFTASTSTCVSGSQRGKAVSGDGD